MIWFTIKAIDEDISPKEYVSQFGDQTEQEIKEFVNSVNYQKRAAQKKGNKTWGWCTVIVEAHTVNTTGRDTLGACSYTSVDDFINNSGYYEDMLKRATEDLFEKARRQNIKIQPKVLEQ